MSEKRDQLQSQAESFGCTTETYPEVDALYLRNIPEGIEDTPEFAAFVEVCREHNVAAIHTWAERTQTHGQSTAM